jgi:hypothetical protein
MENTNNETPKRVLARLVADQLNVVEGGMPPQNTYVGYTITGGGAWDSTQANVDMD